MKDLGEWQPTGVDKAQWGLLILCGLSNFVCVGVLWPSYKVFHVFASAWVSLIIAVPVFWCLPFKQTWQARAYSFAVIVIGILVNLYFWGAITAAV